jgi:hypothetical protein
LAFLKWRRPHKNNIKYYFEYFVVEDRELAGRTNSAPAERKRAKKNAGKKIRVWGKSLIEKFKKLKSLKR